MDIFMAQNEQGLFDLSVRKGDLVGDNSLGTEIMVSLFTDVRAEKDELLPEYRDLRGWWADALLSMQGDDLGTGSKLWLLRRQKQLESVLVQAEAYARSALQWLINEGTGLCCERRGGKSCSGNACSQGVRHKVKSFRGPARDRRMAHQHY